MPTINSASLTLTTVGANTTIDVTYNAVFSVLERRLAGLGLVFRDRIAVIGVDTPPDPMGGVITSLVSINLAVTDGAAPQTISRTASRTVLRSLLQEDIGAGNNDEIRCRIRIEAIGLPPAVTPDEFTDQETLVG